MTSGHRLTTDSNRQIQSTFLKNSKEGEKIFSLYLFILKRFKDDVSYVLLIDTYTHYNFSTFVDIRFKNFYFSFKIINNTVKNWSIPFSPFSSLFGGLSSHRLKDKGRRRDSFR